MMWLSSSYCKSLRRMSCLFQIGWFSGQNCYYILILCYPWIPSLRHFFLRFAVKNKKRGRPGNEAKPYALTPIPFIHASKINISNGLILYTFACNFCTHYSLEWIYILHTCIRPYIRTVDGHEELAIPAAWESSLDFSLAARHRSARASSRPIQVSTDHCKAPWRSTPPFRTLLPFFIHDLMIWPLAPCKWNGMCSKVDRNVPRKHSWFVVARVIFFEEEGTERIHHVSMSSWLILCWKVP